MIHIPSFIQSRAVIHFPALRFLWMILFVFLFPFSTLAQQYITINGKAMDEDHPAFLLEQVMVINLRTQQGIFGNADNSFSISIEKNDTLVITALGYRSDKICFRDSVLKDFYTIIVPLKKISITLKEATIFIHRDLSRIEEDIKKLGYSSKDYGLSRVETWDSPITAV